MRSPYHDGMVRIVVNPNWAKLIDFETTLPSAVEELVRQREERQHRRAARGRSHGVDRPRLNPTAVREVCEVRREMSRWDVENPPAAPSRSGHGPQWALPHQGET